MKSVNYNLGIRKNFLHNFWETAPHIYTDFLNLFSHRKWLLHKDFNDIFLLMTVNHFDKFTLVNISNYSYKVLVPFALTNLVNTQTLSLAPSPCFF